jgi:hypothetical protein
MAESANNELYVPGLYRHGFLVVAETGETYVTLPERIRFQVRDDTTLYTADGGEYLFMVAQLAYGGDYGSCMHLPEVIAQFQPSPILDVSVPLRAGQQVYLPSVEFIDGDVYGESLAEVPEL